MYISVYREWLVEWTIVSQLKENKKEDDSRQIVEVNTGDKDLGEEQGDVEERMDLNSNHGRF